MRNRSEHFYDLSKSATEGPTIIKRISLIVAKVLLLVFILIFIVFPLIFKFCYRLQNSLIFLNYFDIPANVDYSHPEKYGMEYTRNFYVQTDDGMTLGVWHVIPNSLVNEMNETDDQYYEQLLGNGQDVILYIHGNAGTRLSEHRVHLYKLLRNYFHVIAFDYRSFGDSTYELPTEEKLVQDTIFMYNWVANRTKGDLFVWGHSMGTSLTVHSLSVLQQNNIEPKGVVLESPFNNMRDEITEFPFSQMFRYLPWFHYMVTEPLIENGFTFESDRYICRVDAPIMIMHAEDDPVVPFRLGKKLYEEGMRCRRSYQGELTFHLFDGKHKYQHKFICKAPELDGILRDFVTTAKRRTKNEAMGR